MIPDVAQQIQFVDIVDIPSLRAELIAFVNEEYGVAGTVVEKINQIPDNLGAGAAGHVVAQGFAQQPQQVLDPAGSGWAEVVRVFMCLFEFQ